MKLQGDYTLEQIRDILREKAAEYFAGKGPVISTSDSVVEYLEAVMLNPEKELFGVLYLDNRHHVLHFGVEFSGTVDVSAVFPREIVKQALFQNASAILLCHNHPGGSLTPSAEDCKITKQVVNAARLLNIRVLDHIILAAPGKYCSLKNQGEM